jgi:hypothetical protein
MRYLISDGPMALYGVLAGSGPHLSGILLSDVRSQKTGVRRQETGVKSQNRELRSRNQTTNQELYTINPQPEPSNDSEARRWKTEGRSDRTAVIPRRS